MVVYFISNISYGTARCYNRVQRIFKKYETNKCRFQNMAINSDLWKFHQWIPVSYYVHKSHGKYMQWIYAVKTDAK